MYHFESGPGHLNNDTRKHLGIDSVYNDVMLDDWRKEKPKPKKRLVFSFVRNPVTWLQSKWAYAMSQGAIDRWIEEKKKGSQRFEAQCFCRDFQEFIERYLTYRPKLVFNAMLGRLGYHVVEGEWVEGDKKVDFIGKTENLREDLVKVLELANEDFDKSIILNLPDFRVTSKSDEWKEKCQYTPDLRKRVIEANLPLLEMFDYPID